MGDEDYYIRDYDSEDGENDDEYAGSRAPSRQSRYEDDQARGGGHRSRGLLRGSQVSKMKE